MLYTISKDTKTDDPKLLKKVIEFNEKRRKRFDRLANYYIGQHDILERTKPNEEVLSNNKVMVNHARYIVDTSVGYLLGNPVSYRAPKNIKVDPVLDAYKKQTISNLDSEIAKDLGIFGIQYEYVYANEKSEPISIELDNRNTIIVYDTTVQHNKLFALHYRPVKIEGKDDVDYYDVLFVDAARIIKYTLKDDKLTVAEASKPHGFGKVPVIEYRNNSEYLGDFEPVISLIDAYNILQSDRVNDREQLVDAILVATNFSITATQKEELRTSRMISGLPQDAALSYLIKNINETDADVLRKTLEADIHKISMVPNMADENFAENSSGVAIRYKLLSFEQNTQNKERYFEKGLMERFELYTNFLIKASKMSEVGLADVDAVFRRNLPSNDLETSQIINNLTGIVDNETLVGQLSFVDDAKETVEKAKVEALAGAANDPNFGTTKPSGKETEPESESE